MIGGHQLRWCFTDLELGPHPTWRPMSAKKTYEVPAGLTADAWLRSTRKSSGIFPE